MTPKRGKAKAVRAIDEMVKEVLTARNFEYRHKATLCNHWDCVEQLVKDGIEYGKRLRELPPRRSKP